MAPSKVPPDIRAAALADLLAGEQPAVVAEKYGIDPAKVRVWKQRYVTSSVTGSVAPVAPRQPALERQKAELGELVLDLLRSKLEASCAISDAARNDSDWLRRQSAAGLAVFGQWLDSTAFAIGDRLAGASQQRAEPER